MSLWTVRRSSWLAAMVGIGLVEGACKGEVPTQPSSWTLLFGDLHVHTIYSFDAAAVAIGTQQDADPMAACVYAHSCADLDFFALTDHAESLWVSPLPELGDKWLATLRSLRRCAEKGEVVPFAGFEWTSSTAASGVTRAWGHRNVVLYDLESPPRPAAAMLLDEVPKLAATNISALVRMLLRKDPERAGRVLIDYLYGLRYVPACPNIDDQRPDCLRVARTPAELFAYLDRHVPRVGGGPGALVIPHGTAWGLGGVAAEWDAVLEAQAFDPRYERLIELYSGHGSSEPWLPTDDGRARMGPPCTDYLGTATRPPAYMTPLSWESCGQCEGCFQPAEGYHLPGAVQLGLQRSPTRLKDGTPWTWGLIASTDGHRGHPGSVPELRANIDLPPGALTDPAVGDPLAGERIFSEAERIRSFFYTGGLVAVWARGRDRSAIWDALRARRVYGTSGPRIRLRFTARHGEREVWMGSAIVVQSPPRFRIEAASAPESADATCWRPSQRHIPIDRIEVVRIEPGSSSDPGRAIMDPWRIWSAADFGTGSTHVVIEFTDETWDARRPVLYYVRVLQEPTLAVNGTPLRDLEGMPRVCSGAADDPCWGRVRERAWSSPILVLPFGETAREEGERR